MPAAFAPHDLTAKRYARSTRRALAIAATVIGAFALAGSTSARAQPAPEAAPEGPAPVAAPVPEPPSPSPAEALAPSPAAIEAPAPAPAPVTEPPPVTTPVAPAPATAAPQPEPAVATPEPRPKPAPATARKASPASPPLKRKDEYLVGGVIYNDGGRKQARLIAIEANAMVTTEMTPTTMFGADAALVIGSRSFFARIGGGVQGSRAFVLGKGQVANTIQYGMLDGCAGKTVAQHRVRMCAGAEVGAWAHLWQGFEIPGRRYSPHVAGTLKADYQYAFTDRLGLMFGAGVSVPAVGPSLRGADQYGRQTPVVIMGPVAGTLRLGASFRFR